MIQNFCVYKWTRIRLIDDFPFEISIFSAKTLIVMTVWQPNMESKPPCKWAFQCEDHGAKWLIFQQTMCDYQK